MPKQPILTRNQYRVLRAAQTALMSGDRMTIGMQETPAFALYALAKQGLIEIRPTVEGLTALDAVRKDPELIGG